MALSISTILDLNKDYIKDGDMMKKYVASILFGLLVGFILGKTLLEEYHSYHGIKTVASEGMTAYFIKYGEYKTMEDLEKATLSLTNYIYTEKDNLFHVYIGITTNEDNLNKLVNYFKELGYNVSTEEFVLTEKNYLNYLVNADKLIENTKDNAVLGEVSSQILSKYEELVISDSED